MSATEEVPPSPLAVPPAWPAGAAQSRWIGGEQSLFAQLRRHMQHFQAHPGQTLVLLPYAHLLPVARRLWARLEPNGFAPRFETTATWARALGSTPLTGSDLSFDPGLDALTAHTWLEQAGLSTQAALATPMLLECARALAPLAAAQLPDERADWARHLMAQIGFGGEALALEAAVVQTALVWVSHSTYSTDVLLRQGPAGPLQAVFAVQGFQPEPLVAALQRVWGERLVVHAWDASPKTGDDGPEDSGFDEAPWADSPLHWTLHQARDAQDEAQRAAACVLQHVNAGRGPVALVALDRSLTRRIRAMLETAGVALRDETGWKLSTSRSAAQVMLALRASAWDASSDTVLDWLKSAPALSANAVMALEARLRQAGVRDWARFASLADHGEADVGALVQQVQQWRQLWQARRRLQHWLDALRELLQAVGLWNVLAADSAGVCVLEALRLDASGATRLPDDAPWRERRLGLADFTRWVDQTLEAASFTPPASAAEQVVILPLAQLLGRSFGAVVVSGCDEQRLVASPDPGGVFSAAQRLVLGLPGRDDLARAQHAAWRYALTVGPVDILWRSSDEGGEPLMASTLVQSLRVGPHADCVHLGADARPGRTVPAGETASPQPSAAGLLPAKLSASAYSDLRQCPYRFFALRMLGLREAEELDLDLDKRDYGLWLHALLYRFHLQLRQAPETPLAQRRGWLDEAAHNATQERRLAAEEFLPFMAVWPRVRDNYLAWLAQHEAQGLHFDDGELWCQQPLGPVTLVGQIDRVDRIDHQGDDPSAAPTRLVIDYKTEAAQTTRDRVKVPMEDTQLAFYAALLPQDTLRAAYVNVSEGSDGTCLIEQTALGEARAALLQGMRHDLQRVAAGAALPALGEGKVCDHCAARGLCRKDFWPEVTA